MLEGTAVVLKPLSLADVTARYLSWLHNDAVMSGIATSGYTMENLRSYVAEKTGRADVVFYAIRDKATDVHIGNVKLDFHDSRANVSELGLLIGDKDFWGKGVGYEACSLLMRYGFSTLGLRKIYLAVYENNPGAKRLYEKLGFRLEGTLRKHVWAAGDFRDKYLMGIFNDEFK